MATLAELNTRIQANYDEQLQIVNTGDTEKRDMSGDEQDKLETLQADHKDIERQIKLRQQVEKLAEELDDPGGPSKIGLEPYGEADAPADNGETIPPVRGPRTVVAEPARAADKGRLGFQTMGDFAASVAQYCQPGGRQDLRLRHMLAPTTFGSSGVGADGGFAIPPDFRTEINEVITGPNTLLGLTDTLITSSNSITVPVDETTAWQATGGIQANWSGEGSQLTQSKPSLQQRTVQLHKLTVLVPVTEELLNDAPALDRYLGRKAPEKINFEIDRTIIAGTGAGQPLGIINSPCLVSTTRAGTDPVLADLELVYSSMYAPYRGKPGTVWLMNQDVEPFILALNSTTVNNVISGTPSFGIGPTPGTHIYGHRIVYTQACSATGTTGDVIFAALGEYMTATKTGGIRADVSMHVFFDYDQTAFRFILRIAGQPWLSNTISPLNGSATYSSFVTIEA